MPLFSRRQEPIQQDSGIQIDVQFIPLVRLVKGGKEVVIMEHVVNNYSVGYYSANPDRASGFRLLTPDAYKGWEVAEEGRWAESYGTDIEMALCWHVRQLVATGHTVENSIRYMVGVFYAGQIIPYANITTELHALALRFSDLELRSAVHQLAERDTPANRMVQRELVLQVVRRLFKAS